MGEPRVNQTEIEGLFLIDLPVHGDARGWFKENWQREKMVALGLPDFMPVQNNMSFNEAPGVTRGIHAEPWDKLVSVATGRAFCAWVDLREGEGFGRVVTAELTPARAVFVPRGVGNSYQALAESTCYSYLVNEHWSAEAKDGYTFLNLDHPGIEWPMPLEEATISEADRHHPRLADVTPFPTPRPLIVGAAGQLGRALRQLLPDAVFVDRDELDITSQDAVEAFDFSAISFIVNAAAWTAVDAAEGEGRAACWLVNVTGAANLTEAARRHRLPLVHISTDYVFDGTRESYAEDEPFSPLSVYGASKAAADAVVATWPRHYIVRTSWVVGDGGNFVRTMARLADQGVSPSVVDDQFGRLTFADDLARAVIHLVGSGAEYGTYNCSSDGEVLSWFEIAQTVFAARSASGTVNPTDTATFSEGKVVASRPRNSALDLRKLKATGFHPVDGAAGLAEYLAQL